jgi:multidrug resistance protein
MAGLGGRAKGILGDSEAQTQSHRANAVASESSTKNRDQTRCIESMKTSNEDQSISYLYLKFDTELPKCSMSESKMSLPPRPDLSKFVCPLKWPLAKKNVTLWLSCITTCFTAYSVGAYSPGIPQMMVEWNVGYIAVLAGIPAFTAGFAIAPMVLAPFSEINGRRPVFIVTGMVFGLSQLCCGLTTSYVGLIVSRFFVGAGGSTFSTMVGGVVSDIFEADERNTPMALFSSAVLVGTGAGPLVSGFIVQRSGFRWIFYSQAIVDLFLVVVLALFFPETRGSVLLARKAAVLNAWYAKLESKWGFDLRNSTSSSPKRIRWKVVDEADRTNLARMIRISLSRPFHLLFTEPILFSFSLWVSFSWAVLYLTIAAIPLVFHEVYSLTVPESSTIFASLSVGALAYTPLAIVQDKWAEKSDFLRFRERKKSPEYRLFFASVESLLLPLGLFWFGWSARPDFSPAVPAAGLGIASMGIFSIYLATFNYLADVYGPYASSALAAQSFCRNVAGGVLPLLTSAMFHRLGIGAAISVLGGIGLALGVVPWILLCWGKVIRHKSPYAIFGQ